MVCITRMSPKVTVSFDSKMAVSTTLTHTLLGVHAWISSWVAFSNIALDIIDAKQ